MRGSLRGGASQIQQTSSTPAATEEEEEDKRGGPGEEVEEGDGVDRETEPSAALIYVY